jgi:murein endopeptidase
VCLKKAHTNIVIKLEKDIFNEFPREQDNIKKLSKEGKIKLTKADLLRIYGKNWEDIISTLIRIGIIRFVKDSNTYRVEFIFRPALGLAYSS